ncbi:MAG: nicotinate phosphoribosyltransferase [Pseudonocardiales bacterium]|nr:MAG: nicotinate phosphoribosyltransferase [Pseudonocardiales bacterium]
MSAALFTDRYELTMLQAALSDGTAQRRCVFEVFARRLPEGRRYGVVAGTGRLLEQVTGFRFGEADLTYLAEHEVVDDRTRAWLADYRFTGDVDGYAEGELYFPDSPILTVTGTFAEAVVLETLVLSVLNFDSAVASAAARMVRAAGDRPLFEMGTRRIQEQAAPAAARAAYLAGFEATSNLAAGACYGVPTMGTSAHSFTLLHDIEAEAFQAQVQALGLGTTLLVDTYDIAAGIRTAIEVAGPELGAVRIDSGDLPVLAVQSRQQLDSLGATGTRIVLSGDLDEYALAALAAAPVDAYGVGTSVVTGSGAPSAGFVYKLVDVEGRPVAKRSEHKASPGGRKTAVRRHRATGTATEEVVARQPPVERPDDRRLQVPLIRAGRPVSGRPTLVESREHMRRAMGTIPWDGLKLSRGEPAIPTTFE